MPTLVDPWTATRLTWPARRQGQVIIKGTISDSLLLGGFPFRFQLTVKFKRDHTGMRLGELLALTWAEVDFYTGTLTIRRAKSGEGRRVPMNAVVRETLQALRQEQIQAARVRAEGEREILSPYVFGSREGTVFQNFYRDWYAALTRAELHDLRPHDLRHTFASRLVMAGVDLLTVKELLGHKTLAMTLRYSHLSPSHQRQAVERLTPGGSSTKIDTGGGLVRRR